jgi:hypothetical protein
MQGPGYAAPPPRRPSTGALVLLRVLFVAVAVGSIGFLAWAAPLRTAIVTRRRGDWWIFAASLGVLALSFSLLATDHTDDFSTPKGNAGMIILLLNMAACVGYYLYADIRHFRPYPTGYAHPGATTVHGPYGYPQPAPYMTPGTVPQPAVPQPPLVQPSVPVTPVPPPPQRPAPARIDEVRAELDELSDYLRRRDGHGEGGR